MEEFKDIKGYEEYYQVSNLGRVKSLARLSSVGRQLKEKILKPNLDFYGYSNVSLFKNGKDRTSKVHQLVAVAFLNHTPNGKTSTSIVVNHKNFNRADNRLENLELVTMRENGNQKHIKSKSQHTGVSWSKKGKKWRTQITINGKDIHLGTYDDEKLASDCYEVALIYLEQGMKREDIKRIIQKHNK